MGNWEQTNKKGYSEASRLYDQLYSVLADWQLQERKDFAALVPGKQVLDLGCGPGRDLAIFASLGLTPTGIDFSRDMLDRADSRFRLVEADITEPLPFNDAEFSGAWACSIIPCILRLDDWLDEIFRVLEPGGILFLSAREGWVGKVTIPYLNDVEVCRVHYPLEQLKLEVAEHGFQIIRAEVISHDGRDYEVVFARKGEGC